MTHRPYPAYKDSGIEWLGEVPEHWEVVSFRRVVDIAEGQVDPEVEPYSSMNLIAPNHIESGTGRLVGMETAAEQSAESGKYLCKTGEVIYSKIRPALRKACIAPVDCLCSADMYPLSGRHDLSNGYLLWTILSEEFSAYTILESDRVAMPKINRDSLNGMRLLLPPLPEQQAIAAFLDRETAKIDGLVAEQERLIELLTEKRQAVISHAVTRGLDPSVPLKDSGVEWLGQVPEHWDVKRLGWLLRERNEAGSEDLPILSVSIHHGVSDKELDEKEMDRKVTRSDDKSKYKRVVPGDLVYNMMRAWQGGFGSVAIEGQVSPAYVVACPTAEFETSYIERVLRTPQAVEEMKRHSQGVTDFRLRLYWEEFKTLQVPFPPKNEQKEMKQHIEAEIEAFDALIAEARRGIDLLKERRTALISAAVTGKIDVREAA